MGKIIFQSSKFDDDLEKMKNQKQLSQVFFKHEAEDNQKKFSSVMSFRVFEQFGNKRERTYEF
jgi:hypothetical protein